MKLEYKNILCFPQYSVSECGTSVIKNSYVDASGHKRKVQSIDIFVSKNNRRKVMIFINGKQKNMYVYRLVAIAFIHNPENKPEVNHKDGNTLNDSKDNLEWSTDKENKEHAVLNGLTAKGERNGNSVLNLEIVNSIKRDLNAVIRPYKVIAEKHNTSVYNVSDIKNKRSWNY